MILDNISVKQALESAEAVLKLEYSSTAKLKETLDDAVKRLEDSYGVTIDKDIYKLQAENQLSADTLDTFLLNVTECLKQLSLYTCLQVYNHSLTFSLSEVNYLGFARQQLMSSLKYLIDKNLYHKREPVINAIQDALDNIPLCPVKRLFVAMLLFERLGIHEGVAIIAHLLYMGGIVQ